MEKVLEILESSDGIEVPIPWRAKEGHAPLAMEREDGDVGSIREERRAKICGSDFEVAYFGPWNFKENRWRLKEFVRFDEIALEVVVVVFGA